MRIIETKAFTFDELSEKAKDRARDKFRADPDLWGWQSEWWDSAQAFSRIAPIDIREADYDRRHVSVRWTGDDDVAELSGLRAWKWLKNNGWIDWAINEAKGACTMTGYYGDAPFGDAIRAYGTGDPRKVPELRQVFYEAAQEWCKQAAEDMEHAYSDEAIDEMIACNDYEFDEDGRLL
jgi:hypothetical protein